MFDFNKFHVRENLCAVGVRRMCAPLNNLSAVLAPKEIETQAEQRP